MIDILFEQGLTDKACQRKQSIVQLLGAMAYCAHELLNICLNFSFVEFHGWALPNYSYNSSWYGDI